MQIHPDFTTMPLVPEQVLPYVGYRGQALSPAFERDIQHCIQLVRQTARPRFVWASFPLYRAKAGLTVDATTLILEGQDIGQLLSGCAQCLLMAATLGQEIDRLLRYHQARSMADALLIDAAATAMIEAVCDTIEAALSQQVQQEGLALTQRYSCGYGDLPLSAQPAFVKVLNAEKRIGLICTPSFLLHPQKSVTAVMGVCKTPTQLALKQCDTCAFAPSCSLRKAGKHCGH